MLHYRVNPAMIQGRLPDDLEVDIFEDDAWLSVVAFRLSNLRIRPISWLKWSDFWELNLRTYIRDRKGRKGVWFFSLDSTDPVGVIGARMLYGLPYNNARIERSGSLQAGHLSFSSTRKGGGLSTIDASWNSKDLNQNLAREENRPFSVGTISVLGKSLPGQAFAFSLRKPSTIQRSSAKHGEVPRGIICLPGNV